uniref:Uncharacterized protein n=1 Tax=Nelumbo nucifera TaxID=4432 RepID=A0A822Y088_NELNU|nr:TPA_asm: hypothetical protein HUJ06_026130 [Nelumbo nucifera]
MLPSNILYAAEKRIRDERFPKECGLSLARLLPCIVRASSFNREPSSAGILPVSLFPAKTMSVRLEQ